MNKPTPSKPTPEQALELLAKVAYSYKGTRQEHESIAVSIQSLKDAITLKPSTEPKETIS